jgi:ADP-heptose:LPS heptosyltransferase
MKISTMRAVDYWVGIPLCFLSTQFVRIFGSAKGPEKPQKVLFIELSEMGSTIIANPALEKTKNRLGAEIFFLIFEQNADSLRLTSTVPEANIVTIRGTSVWGMALDSWRFLRWARKARIDTVVDLELFSRFTALLSGLCGAKRRVGFHGYHSEGLYRGGMLTHGVSYNTHIHMAKNFIGLVNALLAPKPELPYSKMLISDDEIKMPILPVSEDAREHMRGLVRQVYPDYKPSYNRIVLVNPNGSELLPQRRWPLENFARVAEELVSRWQDVLVLITGSPSEREETLQLRDRVKHPRFQSLAGMHKLTALPALYNISTLLVTNDSGPGHFSAITPIRSIVLFGPETPRLYGSLGNAESITAGLACSPCVTASNHRKSVCNDPVCMRMISVERVMESVCGVLGEDTGSRPYLVQLGAAAHS